MIGSEESQLIARHLRWVGFFGTPVLAFGATVWFYAMRAVVRLLVAFFS